MTEPQQRDLNAGDAALVGQDAANAIDPNTQTKPQATDAAYQAIMARLDQLHADGVRISQQEREDLAAAGAQATISQLEARGAFRRDEPDEPSAADEPGSDTQPTDPASEPAPARRSLAQKLGF